VQRVPAGPPRRQPGTKHGAGAVAGPLSTRLHPYGVVPGGAGVLKLPVKGRENSEHAPHVHCKLFAGGAQPPRGLTSTRQAKCHARIPPAAQQSRGWLVPSRGQLLPAAPVYGAPGRGGRPRLPPLGLRPGRVAQR
jgi:hypothetical protein